MKDCTICKINKDNSSFYKQKNGLHSQCKKCINKRNMENHFKNRDERLLKMSKYNKEYRVREETLLKRSNWYENNIEYVHNYNSIYYKENSDTFINKSREWRKDNPGRVNSLSAKRRASEMQATPDWLTKFDFEYMDNIYIQSKELNNLDGTKYEVDHIIPLQGKGVCGLHVPWNLQILTREENNKKGAKYDRC